MENDDGERGGEDDGACGELRTAASSTSAEENGLSATAAGEEGKEKGDHQQKQNIHQIQQVQQSDQNQNSHQIQQGDQNQNIHQIQQVQQGDQSQNSHQIQQVQQGDQLQNSHQIQQQQQKASLRLSRNVLTMKTADGGGNKCACIASLLHKIATLIRHRAALTADNKSMEGDLGSLEPHWSTLFREFMLDPNNTHCTMEKCVARSDDMLWYVPLVRGANGSVAFVVGSETSHLQVFRRQSRNKPQPGDQSVNWQETVCLNLILQQLDYFVTCAVCTKNSPSNLQIHRKTCQRVYPSPSRRRMDAKGECEEVTYPKIYFAIDSFDEIFTDMVVSEGECVCVELVARDRYRNTEAVIFLGSIRFDVLKKLYDSRNAGAWSWAQRFINSAARQRHEFVKMRGPRGKGFAEMAVTRVASCGFETPMSESGFELGGRFDFVANRRMSDAIVGGAGGGGGRLFSRFLYGGGGGSVRGGGQRGATTPGAAQPSPFSVTPTTLYGGGQRAAGRWYGGGKAAVTSEADQHRQQHLEDGNGSDAEGTTTGSAVVDAQSLAGGGARTPAGSSNNWSMRGIGHALQLLRERNGGEVEEREQLNAFLTYITLPWNSILEDILCPNSRRPILTFDLQLMQNR